MRFRSIPVGEELCDGCNLRREGLCAALEPRRLLGLLSPVRTVISPGQDFPQQATCPDSVFSIVQGWSFIQETLEDGRRQILQFVLPGDTVFPSSENSATTLTAITEVTSCVISFRRLERAAAQETSLAKQLVALLRRECAMAHRHQSMLGRRNAKERLAFLVLETFIRYWRRLPSSGDRLPMPLTQFLLGDALGLTSIHVNRMIAELRRDGVMHVTQQEVLILDSQLLFKQAITDPATDAWMASPEMCEGPPGSIQAIPDRHLDRLRASSISVPRMT